MTHRERCHCSLGCLWAMTAEDFLCDKCRLLGHTPTDDPPMPDGFVHFKRECWEVGPPAQTEARALLSHSARHPAMVDKASSQRGTQ